MVPKDEKPKDEKPLLKIIQAEEDIKWVTKKDMTVEIETQVEKRMMKIFTWVVTVLAFSVFGAIINSLWGLNGEVKELKGKNSAPDNFIQYLSTRLELVEKRNQNLLDSIYKIEKLNIENNKQTKK